MHVDFQHLIIIIIIIKPEIPAYLPDYHDVGMIPVPVNPVMHAVQHIIFRSNFGFLTGYTHFTYKLFHLSYTYSPTSITHDILNYLAAL